MSKSTIFQLCIDGSSWVEPVLSKDKCVLHEDPTQLRMSDLTKQIVSKNYAVLNSPPLKIVYMKCFGVGV